MKRVLNGKLASHPDGNPAPGLPFEAGVFETLLLRHGQPVFWEEHWTRFERGCRWHGFAPPATADAIAAHVAALARENQLSDGVVRYAAWVTGGGDPMWCLDVTEPRPHMRKPEFNVVWGPDLPTVTEGRAHKHLRRSAWLEPLKQGRAAGFDEVLFQDNRGAVVEGAVSNVFFVCAGALHTPNLTCGPLPGIIRAAVISLGRAHGWPVREGAFSRSDVENADEVWVTNSLVGIRPVARLNERVFPTSRPVLKAYREAWRARNFWDAGAA